MSITIHYIVEPEYAETVWCRETLNGIADRASSLRYELCEHNEDTLCDIPKNDSVIVIGTSRRWVARVIFAAGTYSVKTVAVSCQPLEAVGCSSFVLIDHGGATKECLGYLRSAGRTKTALFGINNNNHSYADTVKTGYFHSEDIYYIDSESGMDRCYDEFLGRIENYDSVVCSNYITAVYLMNRFRKEGISVPDRLFVMTYGDSVIGRLMSPSLTTITLNHELLGVQAVNLCRFPFFTQDRDVNITVYVPCRIIAAESTGNVPYVAGVGGVNNPEREDYSTNKLGVKLSGIQALEKLLRLCNDSDFGLISLLASGCSYSKTAELLYISESTVKYRIKRLLGGSGIDSIAEALSLYAKYIGVKDKK